MNALRRIAKKGLKEPLEMLGKPVPDFSLPATCGVTFRFKFPGHAEEVLSFVKAL